jgi:hypothetical protein
VNEAGIRQMIDYLNENPAIIGFLWVILSIPELYLLIFKFESYRAFILKRAWLEILVKSPESRFSSISVTLMFLVFGLAIIDREFGLLSKRVWFTITLMAVANFFGAIARHYWLKYKQRKS